MKYILLVIVLFITGCVTTQELTDARCGPVPTMSQAEWGVNYFVQNIGLKDPSSAQVRNIQIGQKHGKVNIHGNIYGWLVTFELNAKNSYGAYVGYKRKEIIMMDGGTRVWYNQYQP